MDKQALKSFAIRRQGVLGQPRDALGRWVDQNKEDIAAKVIAAGAGLAGGAVAGPVGAAAGQLVGGAVARQGIALGKAAMSGGEAAVFAEIMAIGAGLQDAAQSARDALAGVSMDDLEDVMSKDMIGWAIGHAANYGLEALVPGADMIPGKGAVVAAVLTPQAHKLKQLAKERHGKRAGSGTSDYST